VQPPEIHIDFETRSAADLRKTGLYVYAEDPTTDVWCAAWCVGDAPMQMWKMGQPFPRILGDYITAGAHVYAHNAGFEHAIWTQILAPRYGWPKLDFGQMRCTAAMAAAMALPRDLAGAAVAMGLPEQKDMTGKRLMMQLARPRRVEGGVCVWWDVPEKLERLYAYCAQDVEVERALTKKLRPLSDFEHAIWQLDHQINTRGVAVDLSSVRRADKIVKLSLADLDKEMERLTGGRVDKASQAARLTEWLREQGLDLGSVDKQAVKDALKLDLAPNVRRVLEIRREAAKSSTAKLEAMKLRTSKDGRSRETLMYHGASTGRWSGKGIQLQNLPRPSLKLRDIEAVFEALPAGDPAWVELWGRPLSVISDCLRGMITAGDGRELVMADFANIEGRVLAWLAGEEWKLEAFRAYDTFLLDDLGQRIPDKKPGEFLRKGPDLYKVAASGMLGRPIDAIDDKQRQIGKVSELALGYQGGHGAFISMAKNYSVTPSDIAPSVKAAFPVETWQAAEARFEENNRFDLPVDEWTALRIVVDSWRGAHPGVVDMWQSLDHAAYDAVCRPGKKFDAGRVSYACAGNILWCKLPSGRLLAYVDPKIRDVETPWGATRRAVTYMGVNSVTRRWERAKGYGGLWAENVTQAVARDVMAEAMLRVEAKGWPVVLTVHDEVVSEVPKGSVGAQEFGDVMRALPAWAEALPVAAEGLVSKRYRK
jgi:DNA polymerase